MVDLGSTAEAIPRCRHLQGADRGVMRSLRREVKLMLSHRDIAPYQLVFDCDADESRSKGKLPPKNFAEADEFSEEQKTRLARLWVTNLPNQ